MHRRTAQPFSLDFRASFAKAARVGEEIKKAVKELVNSLDTPMTEVSFLYEPIETWNI